MMMVFDAGISRPDSMMAVETSTSAWPSTNLIINASSSRSPIWPCPMTTRASGQSAWMKAVMDEEDLAAAAELPVDRLLDHGPVEAGHHRLHRQTVEGCRLDQREVPHP